MEEVLMSLVYATDGPNQSSFCDVPLHSRFRAFLFMDNIVIEAWCQASVQVVFNCVLLTLEFRLSS